MGDVKHTGYFDGWQTETNDFGEVHVTPVNDLRDHEPTAGCWCRPDDQSSHDEGFVFVHNSLDGRESLEDIQ